MISEEGGTKTCTFFVAPCTKNAQRRKEMGNEKTLEKSWRSLAQGEHMWVIPRNGKSPKRVKSPRKGGFDLEEIYELASAADTIAVITAAQSYDGYEAMRDRARRLGHTSMADILRGKNYLKYTRPWGKKGVDRKVRSI